MPKIDPIAELEDLERDLTLAAEHRDRITNVLQALRKPADDCPHQQIIDAYHQLLPELPRVREWTSTRQSALRARWRSDPKRQSVDYWRRFFRYVGTSDFLMGRAKPWKASLPWLLKSENFAKVIEGEYHRERAA